MEELKLYSKLIEYAQNGRYGFHMPGHKRTENLLGGLDPFNVDITEIDGFDNLHKPETIIKDAMNQVSKKLGTDKTWFLVNGSTCGILAAISAVTEIGDSIVIGRNCHKAVYNCAEIRNLKVEYLYPSYIEKEGISGSYKPKDLEKILKKNNDVKAVVVTSPTYEGVVSDIEKLSQIAHQYGAVIIVDQAHGAHFFVSEKLPVPAYKLGADITIESTHKTLAALTQTAVLHCVGKRVDTDIIQKYLSIYQSSSPSYILMSSIEKSLWDACEQGQEKTEKLLTILEKFRENVNNSKSFYCIETVLRDSEAVYDIDPTKLIIGIKNKDINGNWLANKLRNDFGFELEMTAENYVLAITTMYDQLEKIEELGIAINRIDSSINMVENKERVEYPKRLVAAEMTAYEANLCEKEEVLLKEAQDRVSGDYVFLYPPGIPLIVPGEILSEDILADIERYKSLDLNLCGLCGEAEDHIKVIK